MTTQQINEHIKYWETKANTAKVQLDSRQRLRTRKQAKGENLDMINRMIFHARQQLNIAFNKIAHFEAKHK